MVSTIDPTLGGDTTEDGREVRKAQLQEQFQAAVDEIEVLQATGSAPFNDTTALVQDPADNTKTMRIDVGAVATATQRTLTMPDADISLVAGVDFAASGANTDITSLAGLTTPLSVAQGGTGAATFTDGGIIFGSGTDAFTAMGVLADGTIVIGDGTTDPTTIAAFTSSTGLLKHESGGLEADISAITTDEMFVGQSAGVGAMRTAAQVRAHLSLEPGTDIEPLDADILRADTDETLTAGFGGTDDADGTKTTGTYTPTYAGGNFKTIVHGAGAFNIAPQSGTGTIMVVMVNASASGAVGVSGFDTVKGDAIDATGTNTFTMFLNVGGGESSINIIASDNNA